MNDKMAKELQNVLKDDHGIELVCSKGAEMRELTLGGYFQYALDDAEFKYKYVERDVEQREYLKVRMDAYQRILATSSAEYLGKRLDEMRTFTWEGKQQRG